MAHVTTSKRMEWHRLMIYLTYKYFSYNKYDNVCFLLLKLVVSAQRDRKAHISYCFHNFYIYYVFLTSVCFHLNKIFSNLNLPRRTVNLVLSAPSSQHMLPITEYLLCSTHRWCYHFRITPWIWSIRRALPVDAANAALKRIQTGGNAGLRFRGYLKAVYVK